METKIFLLNLFSVIFLTGVIWLVQLVQYPHFSQIGAENFPKFHASHSFWITPVVAPPMIIELITSIFLIIYPLNNEDSKIFWAGLILTLLVWLSTFFLQVPMHEKLSQGFDAEAHKFLVNSNWIRTIGWSLHSFLLIYLVWKNLK